MRGRISKSRTQLFRPKASQQQQLDAVVSTGAGMRADIISGRHSPLPEPTIEGQEKVLPDTRRKRRVDSNGDDSVHQPKRAKLTRENLALFNKMPRKKGHNTASVPSESTVKVLSTRTVSSTSSGFADQARRNGIVHPLHSKPPANLENIRERHARSRATASPPEFEYNRYVNNVGKALNEATMVFEVGVKLLKEYDDEGYNRVFSQPFTGFPKDVGFNNGLSALQPDFAEGLEKKKYVPFPIEEHVNGAVLYKDDPFSLALPHLAGKWKGRGKDMEEARLQSAYDGAAIVYARNQALSYIGKPDTPGHAEVTTFTTDGTNINFFAHYAAPSEDGTLEYHQYQYASANVKDSHQGHKDGRRGLRNQQDHAREQSYALRDQLKDHWKQSRDLHPITEDAQIPAIDSTLEETNENEDEADYEIVEQPCQPTPAASSSVSLKSLPPADNRAGQKRKASSSHKSSHRPSIPSSRKKSYWTLDAESGCYFHKHSDGRVTWFEDSDDES